VLGANIILPKKALKRDNRYQRDKKRKLCKRRAAIEPIFLPKQKNSSGN
jgi:IS5 family transposase